MNKALQTYLQERSEWQQAFDSLLQFGTEGVLKDEVVEAKKIFFAKLGSVHEMSEELYETTSQSFLEWYLFDYSTRLFGKTPAVVYASLKRGPTRFVDLIARSTFDHWSLFEVKAVTGTEIVLQDLLFSKTRSLLYDSENPDARIWKVKEGQIIQARLFPTEDLKNYFLSHLWIHPDAEREYLQKICSIQKARWSEHRKLLVECLEAVIRSHGLQSQIKASRSVNWLYQELIKIYA